MITKEQVEKELEKVQCEKELCSLKLARCRMYYAEQADMWFCSKTHYIEFLNDQAVKHCVASP